MVEGPRIRHSYVESSEFLASNVENSRSDRRKSTRNRPADTFPCGVCYSMAGENALPDIRLYNLTVDGEVATDSTKTRVMARLMRDAREAVGGRHGWRRKNRKSLIRLDGCADEPESPNSHVTKYLSVYR